jgi:NADPH:quinone reductase-like Zn-dependent oxidoreductase
MHKKVAKVNEGSHIFITGASGGVGSALLDLGKRKN